jgi:hypothetical protein
MSGLWEDMEGHTVHRVNSKSNKMDEIRCCRESHQGIMDGMDKCCKKNSQYLRLAVFFLISGNT